MCGMNVPGESFTSSLDENSNVGLMSSLLGDSGSTLGCESRSFSDGDSGSSLISESLGLDS